MYAVLDPDPEIRGGGGGERPVTQKIFFALPATVLSKNMPGGGGGPPPPPPPPPPPRRPPPPPSHPGPSTTGMYVPNLNYKYGHFTFWGVGHTPVVIQPYFTHNCMSFLAISSSLLLLLLVIILP